MLPAVLLACADPEYDLVERRPDADESGEKTPPKPSLDLDGDGWGDFVVGAPNANHQSGRVYAWFGSAEGTELSAPTVYLLGDRGAQMGLWVESAGDITGDGHDDLVVGGLDGSYLCTGPNEAEFLANDRAILARGQNGWLRVTHGVNGVLAVSAVPADSPVITEFQAVLSQTSGLPIAVDLDDDGFDELVYAVADELFVQRGPLDVPGEPPVRETLPAAVLPLSAPKIFRTLESVAPVMVLVSDDAQSGSMMLVHDLLSESAVDTLPLRHGSTSSFTLGDFDTDGSINVAVAGPAGADDRVDVLDLSGAVVGQLPAAPDEREGDGTGDQLAAVDVTGDGWPELLHTRPKTLAGGTLDIWRQEDIARGTPMASIAAPDGAGLFEAPRAVGLGDPDGDGVAEIVVVNDSQVISYPKLGSPGLTGFLTVVGESRVGEEVASAGDINGDGFGDLLVGSAGGKELAIFLGDETGITLDSDIVLSSAGGQRIAGLGDLDGDGTSEFATWTESASEPSWVELFAGGDQPEPWSIAELQATKGTMAGRDLDHDGYSDIVLSSPSWTGVWWGGGSGPSGQTPLLYASIGGTVALPGDYDGDGRDDIVVTLLASEDRLKTCVLHVPLYPEYLCREAPGTAGLGVASAAIGDFDEDGWPDIAVGSETCGAGTTVYVAWGGNWRESALAIPLPPDAEGACHPEALGDVDADGFPDFAVGVSYSDASLEAMFVVHGARPGAVPALTPIEPPGNLNAAFGASLR